MTAGYTELNRAHSSELQ